MTDDKSTELRKLANWFKELGKRARHEPLERILDEMIGSERLLSVGDDDPHEESQTPYKELPKEKRTFTSPFREYYFGKEARKRAEARYLMFLSSLRVFIGAIREYKHGTPLFIADLVEFADIHERNGIALSDTTPFASAEKAVHLMTAHKAKGLEFDTVFVASCQEDVWAGRGYPNKLPFPMNLPIEREEGGDDRLRLFYVALTRAKSRLFVTAYRQDDAGKASLKLGFVTPDKEAGAIATHFAETDANMSASDLSGAIGILPTSPEFFPIVPGERAILLSLIKDYRMSVTHLNNFLNVVDGGPALFLEQNLLRFPQGKRPSSAYGSAMHKAIEMFYRDFKRTKKLPGVETLVNHFRTATLDERLTESEYLHFLHAGEAALPVWYEESGKHAKRSHESEVSFKDQGVIVEGAPLSGKIDKMIISEDEVEVFDFKTGKAKEKWDGRDAREKITLLSYKRQLIFYKLLVEHAHGYAGKTVERGVLEFIEPVDGKIKTLELEITKEDTERLAKLIGAVHTRIMSLDFPDTEQYSKDVEGILQFEEDLLRS
jgi:DNA helicase-2/ATP-dependent DNA helicase PcrA